MLENQIIGLNNKDDKEIVNIDEKVAVVMALYYENDMEHYFKYLSIIPQGIDIFIISSNQVVLAKAMLLKAKYLNLNVLEKENRGRDLSALLVAFRTYINDYDYLCFLHDKKSKHASLYNDLSLWIENLWGNMVPSAKYIEQVISILRGEEYGVLLPPKPIGTYNDSMYADPWDNDFDNVLNLANMLHVEKTIRREDKDMVSLGSVFWCRTKALDKLFVYPWDYSDFPEEPMPDDGTISHAIERIFGFVALDAGYKVKTILNSSYASKVISILQEKLQYTYDWLWKEEGIKNTHQLSLIYEEKEEISRIFNKGDVYLYGAGDYGIQYLHKLEIWGYKPKAFVVSDGQRKSKTVCNLPVKELSEIENTKNAYFIITTNLGLQEILVSTLEKNGIYNYYKMVI